jgi:predicted RNA-binding Zn-ribbon protein involved in translation (DUF1610 family)
LRLYVVCHNRSHAKIYTSSAAQIRSQLPYAFELQCPSCGNRDIYHNYEVFAEEEPTKVPVGAILGGILGAIIAGPIGALGGAILAGGVGAGADNADRQAVERFNSS